MNLIVFLLFSISVNVIPDYNKLFSASKNSCSSTKGIKIEASQGKVLPFKSISKFSGKYYFSSP